MTRALLCSSRLSDAKQSKAKQKKKEGRRLQSLYAPSLHKNKSSTEVHYIIYNYMILLLLPIPVNSAL